ncbi:hypothetical protein [Sphingomonas sp.]|jgi:hypothetical protein|uniref:hypothetical protein n=1 Tax=Sphingomonas sp. TaxID=28214 RepID=UPI002DF35921|nr:hypothetical protein [Sphingomonas sp.]
MLLEYIGPIAEDENGRPVPPETVSFFKRIAVPPGRYRLLGNVSAGNSNDGWQLLVETGQAGRSPLVFGTVPPHSDRKLNDIVVVRTGMVPSVKLRAVTHN